MSIEIDVLERSGPFARRRGLQTGNEIVDSWQRPDDQLAVGDKRGDIA